MKLTVKQKKQLKAQAHKLSPMVHIGKNGINESLVEETLRALNDHELIKIKISSDDKVEFSKMADAIVAQTKSSMVDTIGRIAIVYKRSNIEKKQKITFKD